MNFIHFCAESLFLVGFLRLCFFFFWLSKAKFASNYFLGVMSKIRSFGPAFNCAALLILKQSIIGLLERRFCSGVRRLAAVFFAGSGKFIIPNERS